MATAPTSSHAVLLVMADAIEISDQHRQVGLYLWREVKTDNGFKRAWTENDGQSVHTGTTMYALLGLAQRAGLQIAAWQGGTRIA